VKQKHIAPNLLQPVLFINMEKIKNPANLKAKHFFKHLMELFWLYHLNNIELYSPEWTSTHKEDGVVEKAGVPFYRVLFILWFFSLSGSLSSPSSPWLPPPRCPHGTYVLCWMISSFWLAGTYDQSSFATLVRHAVLHALSQSWPP